MRAEYRVRRWLALGPALVFGHVLVTYLPDGWPDVFWICNLSSCVLALGLLFRRVAWIWFAVLWLLVGMPLWAVDATLSGTWQPHGFGVHLLCPAVGLVALRGVSPPAYRVLSALAGMVLLQVVCWVFTPPIYNVNLVFGSPLHRLGMALGLVGMVWTVDQGLLRWLLDEGADGSTA